jgi:hypothetical protein
LILQGSGASEEIAKEQAAKKMIDILMNFQTNGKTIVLHYYDTTPFRYLRL